MARTFTARLLLFLLMISAAGITGTQAMHTYQAVTAAGSSSIALRQPLMPPVPYSAIHLLAAGLTDNLGQTGKCFRA